MSKKAFILSDLHVDHYLNSPNKKGLDSLFKEHLKLKPDYIIIAGDISNTFTHTVNTLDYFGERCEKVFWTYGNHDYVIPRQFFRHINGNFGYIQEIKQSVRGNVKLLDGSTVYDIGNKKIGGTMGCADWQYSIKYLGETMKSMSFRWERWYDSYWGCGVTKCIEMMGEEKRKIDFLLKEGADILVTHFCPFTEAEHIHSYYRKDPLTGFFYFNAEDNIRKLAKKTNPMWIYGHTHSNYDFDFKKVKFLVHPYGYPSERAKNNVYIEQYLIEV